MHTYLVGLGTGLSLIVAIGAQNAFVLRQGLLRSHVFAVCLFCAVSDAILVTLGVFAAGTLTRIAPWFTEVMRWGGAAFLILYGLRAARSALAGGDALRAAGQAGALWPTLATVAALTWANPHVYLDTVVLLGRFPGQAGLRGGCDYRVVPVLLCAGLRGAAAGADLCPAARLAGAGYGHRAGDVVHCRQADPGVTWWRPSHEEMWRASPGWW